MKFTSYDKRDAFHNKISVALNNLKDGINRINQRLVLHPLVAKMNSRSASAFITEKAIQLEQYLITETLFNEEIRTILHALKIATIEDVESKSDEMFLEIQKLRTAIMLNYRERARQYYKKQEKRKEYEKAEGRGKRQDIRRDIHDLVDEVYTELSSELEYDGDPLLLKNEIMYSLEDKPLLKTNKKNMETARVYLEQKFKAA